MNKNELDFAVFCIENVAETTERSGNEVYKIMTEETDVLDNYIIPFYDALHTQGKEYIVRELIEVIQEKGGRL